MHGLFDKATLDLPCPNCGNRTEKEIEWLKQNTEFTCPSCNSVVSLNSDQFREELRKAEKAIEDLKKQFGA